MSEFTPEYIFSPLTEYQNVEEWDCERWRNFCRLLVNTFTIIPGIDPDYVNYFWDEFSVHEALQKPTISGKLDDEEEEEEEEEEEKDEEEQEEEEEERKGEEKEGEEVEEAEKTRDDDSRSVNDVSNLLKGEDIVEDAITDSRNGDQEKQSMEEEPPTALKKELEPPVSNAKGQQLTQSGSLHGHEVLDRSDLKIVDLNGLSECDIRSIYPTEDRTLLTLVTLEGGARAWCNYHELRTRKQALGDGLPEIVAEAAENMQNIDVGK